MGVVKELKQVVLHCDKCNEPLNTEDDLAMSDEVIEMISKWLLLCEACKAS